ncbi:neuronal acetylcholine receptor subunit beta-4-like isoform X1 [Paramacrobiotus metropolitanus]|uniref:neuronal acetylcholine receptor subunit beta-4-like isoform X1 n=1 Tax=Paramacrobiotus metropolitanus TaxID=2943436 RepID=UPI002445F452|nr:neuronal acetylcholine receptor subunit beta-4-like isoform X1 [Paramacrobiotus metropolitanus]
MYVNSVIIFLCCSAGLIGRNNIIAASSVKTSALVRQLLAADDVHVPPNADQAGQPVNVSLSLTATGVQHDRPDSDLVTLLGFLNLEWTNSRLTWDPLQHHNITLVHLPADRVWLPDMTLYNSYNACKRVFPEERELLGVRPDGTVSWSPYVSFPLTCSRTQNAAGEAEVHCAVKLASWLYDSSVIDVIVVPSSSVIGTTGSVHMFLQNEAALNTYSYAYRLGSRYHITGSTVVRRVLYYPSGPEAYPYIEMTFTATRAAASQLRLAWVAFILSFPLTIMR